MSLCQVCGNEIEPGSKFCRFCGSSQSTDSSAAYSVKTFSHRTVNLEKGMPFVEPALNHLKAVIDEARRLEIQVLTIIHGYGSSGKGGVIRTECRNLLDYMCSKGELSSYITGEDFHRRNGLVKNLLSRFPQLSDNKNLNRNNRGITLVIF